MPWTWRAHVGGCLPLPCPHPPVPFPILDRPSSPLTFPLDIPVRPPSPAVPSSRPPAAEVPVQSAAVVPGRLLLRVAPEDLEGHRAYLQELTAEWESAQGQFRCSLDAQAVVSWLLGHSEVTERRCAAVVTTIFEALLRLWENKIWAPLIKEECFRWVPREINQEPDALVNAAMDGSSSFCFLHPDWRIFLQGNWLLASDGGRRDCARAAYAFALRASALGSNESTLLLAVGVFVTTPSETVPFLEASACALGVVFLEGFLQGVFRHERLPADAVPASLDILPEYVWI